MNARIIQMVIPMAIFGLKQISGFGPPGIAYQKGRISMSLDSSSPFENSSYPPTQATIFDTKGGVKTFENWFASFTHSDSNKSLRYVKHNYFSNGRGLEYRAKDWIQDAIITIPKDRIIHSRNSDGNGYDWDVSLTVQLLRECQKGTESKFYGYCQLLTQGYNFNQVESPPSVAPNALRRWTPVQKEMLERSGPRGRQLMKVQRKQENEWVEKYNNLTSQDKSLFTLEQFMWAMEVVYSRAFRGDFGSNLKKQLLDVLASVGTTAIGAYYYLADPVHTDDRVTLFFGILIFLPLLLSKLSRNSEEPPTDAVLLPFIDSANHMEEAMSLIQFDPMKGMFTLTLTGKNCIVDEIDCSGKTTKQLYISYGRKSDTELLLNYGFIRNIQTGEACTSAGDHNAWLDQERCQIIDSV